MAIVAYTGLPGHGKSYGVVENVILPALTAGRTVWTNIPLNMEAVREAYPTADVNIFDVKSMTDDPKWCVDVVPPGVVFVLDEVWRVWPAGLKAHVTPTEYKTFLAEHRHRTGVDNLSTEIVLVTQDLSQISNFARELIETTSIAHKLTAVGANKRFRVDIYQGSIKGQRAPKDKLIRSIQGSYKASVYRFYQSHTMSTTGQAGVEKTVDKRNTIWQRASIIYGVPIGLVLSVLALYQVSGFFFRPDVASSVADQGSGRARAPLQSSTPVHRAELPPHPAITPFSDDWRFAGVVASPDGQGWAMISGADGRARRIPLSRCGRFADTHERYCDVAGARVTSWTGPEPDSSQTTDYTSVVQPSPS